MRKKVFTVAGFTSQHPEPEFMRCERADRPGKLYEEAPDKGRQVQPYGRRPTKDEERAEHDEEDEESMDQCDPIGKQRVPHRCYEFCAWSGGVAG